ncbi:hypothetical protein [Rhizobium sp. C1]|uniref:hypothetical protein n=1 Tax=Rhizobium sp. C1 TaxID=1349799 RepID=UPI001E5F5AFF|nr:hypothetical protein [Rhizobium sp. C1]MCD2176857.1 hypothetical protein [Rhizobium sp. C1]
MKNPIDWTDGFGCGAMFVATAYTLALAGFLHIEKSDLPTYATIWAALLALFGAWLSLRAIRQQNQTTIDIFTESEAKKIIAARAILSIFLSELSEAAIQNIARNFSMDLLPLRKELASRDFVPFSFDTIDRLKDCVPLFPPEISQRIIKILSIYQIMKSRDGTRNNVLITGNPELVYGEHNAIDSAINWAVINSMIDSVYPYARGIDNHEITIITKEDVALSFLQAGIFSDDIGKISKLIESRQNSGDLEMNFLKRFEKLQSI